MKTLKTVVLVVLLIPIVLLLASLFLPSRYRVERSTLIRARPEAIFTCVNIPKKWPEWTAWTPTKYPDMQMAFTGPDAGAGATYTWAGKTSGQGTLKITRSDPDKGIAYALDFEHGKYLSDGGILLEPSGDSVKVTWFNQGDLGWNPVSRYFGLLMDKMMGPDFEEGLENLRRKAESK
ncbi:MAG TPA: SRPBCC family protein [Candidatus Binatia bacterium]|nr:SRPBCC family protein [Candidatus Binatia bacterium]